MIKPLTNFFIKKDHFLVTKDQKLNYETSHVYFIDYYSKERIYTHKDGKWRGFTSGGTLKNLIENLRDYVMRGDKLNVNYFMPVLKNGFSNPWGYGDDILKVKGAAVSLGIAE